MARSQRSFRLLLALCVFTVMGACGSSGGDEATSGTEVADTTQATGGSDATREDVLACLEDAGLEPEDTGLFVIGNDGTNVEAIGVVLGEGMVQVWVFDDAEGARAQVDSWEAAVGAPGAQSPAASEARGNVAVAYESEPATNDRNAVGACLPAPEAPA